MIRLPGALLEAARGVEVLVLGEPMLDTFLDGRVDRLCREAPLPVVDVEERLDAPGGAANTAANVAALGAHARLLAVVGDDDAGALLRRELAARGVDCDALQVSPRRRTLVKTRVSADGRLLCRFDEGTTARLDGDAERRLLAELEAAWRTCEAIVVSDYGYGALTPLLLERLRELQAASPRVVVADARDLRAYRGVGLTAVKPNYEEALGLLRAPAAPDGEGRAERVAGLSGRLLRATGAAVVAVTLDSEGAIVLERGRPPYRTYAEPKDPGRAIGAGDTFVAALALALAAGGATPAAAELAQTAAGIAAGKSRTAVCDDVELRERIIARRKRVSDLDGLDGVCRLYRAQGRTIVFTNGCFDILHRGHVTMLNRAKELGDLLIVAVNADASVARLKGPDRPINPLEDRMELLAALSCVDVIVPFEEDTPAKLIRLLRPDVYVKGGDYTAATLPEAPIVESLGGRVRILPYVEDRSTSEVIERIRALG